MAISLRLPADIEERLDRLAAPITPSRPSAFTWMILKTYTLLSNG